MSSDQRYNKYLSPKKKTITTKRFNIKRILLAPVRLVLFILRPLYRNPVGKFLKETLSNKEIASKIFITVLVILIYRLLSSVPLPGIDMRVFQDVIGSRPTTEANYIFSLFTGGRLESPSIVGLGLAAYINASIIMQMLPYAIPRLKELQKEGERGKKIINQLTRYIALPLALLYSIGYLVFLSQQDFGTNSFLIPHVDGSSFPSIMRIAFMAIVLTAGTLFLMWLSEIITEKGIGNGSSVIITIGIVATLPALLIQDLGKINFGETISQLAQGNVSALFNPLSLSVILSLIGFIVMIVVIIFINESHREIPVQYARRVRGTETGRGSNLPIKFTMTGVLPIIFTYAFLSLPQLLIPLLERVVDASSGFYQFLQSLKTSFLFSSTDLVVDANDNIYALVYFVLVIIFGVFYAFIIMNPQETAENLQKSGAFVPGIRPGKSTQQYISGVLVKMSFAGSIVLALIALIPILSRDVVLSSTGGQLAILSGIGGTSILILVSVVLDTMRQYKSLRATRSYEKYI